MRGRSLNNLIEYPGFFDDFLGDTINTDLWLTAGDTGDTAFATPATQVVHGTIQGSTAATDDNQVEIAGALQWRSSNGPIIFVARFRLDVVTNVAFNVGLNDAATETTLPVELSGTTFTSNASTGTYVVFDTDATTDTIRAFSVNADADHSSPIDTTLVPVADTYVTVKLMVKAGATANRSDVDFWVDVDGAAGADTHRGTLTAALTDTTLLAPWVSFENRSATAHVMNIDYIGVQAPRG